jgi:hypothetical protein
MENDTEIANVILSNLKKLKEESEAASEARDDTIAEDNPDDLVKEIPKFRVKDEEFDYFAKKSFFDEIYFKDSKLFKT